MAKNGYVGNTLEIPKTQQKCSGYYYILQIGFGINRDALTPLCLTPDMVYVINGNEKKPTGLFTISILLCSINSQGLFFLNTQTRFASAVFDGVLGPPRLVWYS